MESIFAGVKDEAPTDIELEKLKPKARKRKMDNKGRLVIEFSRELVIDDELRDSLLVQYRKVNNTR